jgi:hypothetical protein
LLGVTSLQADTSARRQEQLEDLVRTCMLPGADAGGDYAEEDGAGGDGGAIDQAWLDRAREEAPEPRTMEVRRAPRCTPFYPIKPYCVA